MGVREDLIAAKALIDAPSKWIKSDSTKSCRRCAALACDRLVFAGAAKTNSHAMWAALYRQLPDVYQTDEDEHGVCIGRYNDARATTHADIMALFDRAIESAQAGVPS